MPIYEYQCQACQHEFEALQKISEAPLTDCPACNAPSLRKKISAAGFRLSGSGWYETDFKSKNKKNLAGDSAGATEKSGSDAKGDSKSGGEKSGGEKSKSETKPAAKPAASSDK